MLFGVKRYILQDDRGGITIFVLILTVMLLVVGGMAVDYQRYELARADLQDALDRGVLAATNSKTSYDTSGGLSLEEQAKDLIESYFASRNYRPEGLGLTVAVNQTTYGRAIAATANEPLRTIFLRMMGVDTLNVSVQSGAIQAAPKLEIALVLDISGSMGWNSTSAPGTKLAQLKVAAKQFIDTVLAPDTEAQTLVSIVPFSQQVNLRSSFVAHYNMTRHHTYSNCLEYRDLRFDTAAMPLNPGTAYRQSQHFIDGGTSSNRLYGCPKNNNAITAYSNNAAALKSAIDALTVETWTATYMGMKWGTALMDPTSRPIVSERVSNGQIPSEFAGWPHAWNDPTVRKITVVMSDGQNTKLHQIVDSIYKLNSLTYWNTTVPSSAAKFAVVDNNRTNSAGVGEGDVLLKQICDQSKLGQNSTVYTIGFELAGEPKAEAALRDCASSDSTFYLVNGVEISTAFQNIADEIVTLKLTN